MARDSNSPILVTLEPWEYDHALHVGARRFTANWGKPDAPHYDKSRMEDDRTAQAAACVAELAVAKHNNKYWPGHVWHHTEHNKYRNVPDVGKKIEVKRIRNLRKGVPVRLHQLGQGLILWAAYPVPPEFREVHLYGWLPYDEAWELGEESDYASTTRLVPKERFRLDPEKKDG
jgi:hypothetical protein